MLIIHLLRSYYAPPSTPHLHLLHSDNTFTSSSHLQHPYIYLLIYSIATSSAPLHHQHPCIYSTPTSTTPHLQHAYITYNTHNLQHTYNYSTHTSTTPHLQHAYIIYNTHIYSTPTSTAHIHLQHTYIYNTTSTAHLHLQHTYIYSTPTSTPHPLPTRPIN